MKSCLFVKLRRRGLNAVPLAVLAIVVAGVASAEPVEVRIRADDRMQFDVERFVVQPGQQVTLTLEHIGQMPKEAMGHNVVILADPNANPVSFGQRILRLGGNFDNHFVPEVVLDEVIAFTQMIGGGETTTIEFTAPQEPGEYPYLCSFPMHPELMTGVMEVEGEVSDSGVVDAGVPPDTSETPGAGELGFDPDALPLVPDGFEVEIWAREPDLFHPSGMAFDGMGRLYVGGGPQYRNPAEDSPKDSIWVLIDENGDGRPDDIRQFAIGLNSVQGLAWRGGELWVANAPDVTVLRDTSGDLIADEYVKVYTNLGHLRHGLHGFNWAPDGRIYMTQGDSRVQAGAPQAFRDLHGVRSDEPDNHPLNEIFTPDEYEAGYIGSWPTAAQGGWLRAGEQGRDLEIFSRGGRNPWGLTFDSGFNWIGSEQDPGNAGDKVFMPFEGAHFGYNHPRGGSWTADTNPAVVPASSHFTRFLNNSLVGMQFYFHDHFPDEYRNVVFINDWVNRNIYVFRPEWDGALITDAGDMETFADGGEHAQGPELEFTPSEGDPLFRPTDLEVGPDGALYVASWGTQYGSRWAPFIGGDADAEVHWGRVFRIRHSERPLTPRAEWYGARRDEPYETWSVEELIDDLGAQLPVWRIDAQDELVRRGDQVAQVLRAAILAGDLPEMAETYAIWALGRIGSDPNFFAELAEGANGGSLNGRIQALRVIGDRGMPEAAPAVAGQLKDAEPRVRFAAAQALRWLSDEAFLDDLLAAVEAETDRLSFYAQWLALERLVDTDGLVGLAVSSNSINIQAAALLALAENDEQVSCDQVTHSDEGDALEVAVWAIEQWIERQCHHDDSD